MSLEIIIYFKAKAQGLFFLPVWIRPGCPQWSPRSHGWCAQKAHSSCGLNVEMHVNMTSVNVVCDYDPLRPCIWRTAGKGAGSVLGDFPWLCPWIFTTGPGVLCGGTFSRPENQWEAKPRSDPGVVSFGSTHFISFVLPVFPSPNYSTVTSSTNTNDSKRQNYN